MPEARGAQCELPTLDQGRIPRDRPEKIRFSDIVMIQPVRCPCFKRIGVQLPTAIWNRDTVLVLFIPLAVQGSESKTLADCEISERASGRQERRGLVVVAVEGAKYPIQARNFDGYANSRVRRIFNDVCRKVRLAKASD